MKQTSSSDPSSSSFSSPPQSTEAHFKASDGDYEVVDSLLINQDLQNQRAPAGNPSTVASSTSSLSDSRWGRAFGNFSQRAAAWSASAAETLKESARALKEEVGKIEIDTEGISQSVASTANYLGDAVREGADRVSKLELATELKKTTGAVRLAAARTATNLSNIAENSNFGLGKSLRLEDEEWDAMYEDILKTESGLRAMHSCGMTFVKRIDALAASTTDLSTVILNVSGATRKTQLSRDCMHFRMLMNDLTDASSCTARGQLDTLLQQRVQSPIEQSLKRIAELRNKLKDYQKERRREIQLNRELDIMNRMNNDGDTQNMHTATYPPEVFEKKEEELKECAEKLVVRQKDIEKVLSSIHNSRQEMMEIPFAGLKACQLQFFRSCAQLVQECVPKNLPALRNPMFGKPPPLPPSDDCGVYGSATASSGLVNPLARDFAADAVMSEESSGPAKLAPKAHRRAMMLAKKEKERKEKEEQDLKKREQEQNGDLLGDFQQENQGQGTVDLLSENDNNLSGGLMELISPDTTTEQDIFGALDSSSANAVREGNEDAFNIFSNNCQVQNSENVSSPSQDTNLYNPYSTIDVSGSSPTPENADDL
eukprot:g2043.t1